MHLFIRIILIEKLIFHIRCLYPTCFKYFKYIRKSITRKFHKHQIDLKYILNPNKFNIFNRELKQKLELFIIKYFFDTIL